MSRMLTAVVVGGGTAGCTVSATLAANGIRVHLVEPGGEPAHHDARDFFRALQAPNASTTQLVSTTSDVPARAYTQASVRGGGGAVNAMVTLKGEAADYDEWANKYDCHGWTWSEVEPTFSALSVPTYFPGSDELGGFGALFLDSVDGAERAPLAWAGRRVSALTRLHAVRQETGLIEFRSGVSAHGVLVANDAAVGVTLGDGGVIEADAVVLCAGALATPGMLRSITSRINESAREHVGNNLQDHPAMMFTCEAHDAHVARANGDQFVVTAIATMRDESGRAVGQLMAYNHVGDGSPRVGIGVSLLEVHSRGRIDESGFASFNMLSDERDVANMRAVLRWALSCVASPALASLGAWVADDLGTTCADLSMVSDGDVDAWLRRHVGFQSHASGSCRMANTPDSGAVSTTGSVFGLSNVWVADASVFPLIPRANTNLPVMMVATRIAQSIVGRM